jgi:putative hemolysin
LQPKCISFEFFKIFHPCKILFFLIGNDEPVIALKYAEPQPRPATGVPRPGEVPDTSLRPSTASHPPHITPELGKYQVRLAETLAEREAACRLRFSVFNVELGEGIADSWHTGLDQDRFDLFCDHLIVVDRACGRIVGTYRMQSGVTACENLGYYSEQEFDFTPYRRLRPQVLELGRASIDRDHRTSEVLMLLWRGIAQYARSNGLRYLIGCSSLNSRDPQQGWSLYRQLGDFLAPESLRTRPNPRFALPAWIGTPCEVKVPRLLRSYIAVGARICGEPAWDREFGTIDFLTLLDLAQLSPAARSRFLPGFAAAPVSCEPVSVS